MSSSTDVASALDVALRVASVLESMACDYFVGGSIASSLQGEPRATNDIDLVVAMLPHRVREFAERLGPDFEVDQEMLRDALVRGSCANIFYLPMVTKIDIFALGPSPYDEVELNRRRRTIVRTSPLTGEPDAGNPPVRFGGRGAGPKSRPPYPYPSRCYTALQW